MSAIMKTYADFTADSPVKPYFLDSARAYFTRLGGDPDHADQLAAWAQYWREAQRDLQDSGAPQAEVDDFGRRGVMVTAGGDLIADAFHVYDARGLSRGWFIDKARLAELGVPKGTNDARLVTPVLERILGQRISLATLRDVGYGAGAAVKALRMPGFELRARRELLGLTEEALGAAVGEVRGRDPIRKDTVHRWENGREPVPAHMASTLESIEDMTASLVEQVRDEPHAWRAVTDDETAQQRTGRSWATARWIRHAYARAIASA